MKIYRKKDKIIVELDFWQHKSNLYNEEEEKELTYNLIGVICGDEQGIAQLIDLSYKDDQQIGQFLVNTALKDDEFKKLCKDLEIDFFEYPICVQCKKPIFGHATWSKKGGICFDCELKNNS